MSYNLKPHTRRNIVFFGETGTGKSSAINLILGTDTLAVSHDTQPCTKVSACYEVTLLGTKYNLWDTRGLGGSKGIFPALFGDTSIKELQKFLKERHEKHEIDLAVFCIRGSRATKASVKYFNIFCGVTRRLVAPVAIMVTHLEKEVDMESWWSKNSFRFNSFKMEFDGHVCITTLPRHPRSTESKRSLVHLITRNYHWEVAATGSYFGSHVLKTSSAVQPRKRMRWNLRKAMHKNDVDAESFVFCPTNATSSTIDQSFYTPAASPVSRPVVSPPTPRSPTTSERVPRIKTDLPRVGQGSQPSEETSGTGSPSLSMSYHDSQSSQVSLSEVHLQSYQEENKDCLNELPFEFPIDSVKRRKNYAAQRNAFGDIWECDLLFGGPPRMVAVKVVKTSSNHEDLESHKKELHRELKVWGSLRHRNVVPLLGVVLGFGLLPSMVSPWFRNGSLSRLLAQHQTLEMPEKTRLLGDIASGLLYLHNQNVIHGDLHSDNVMIDEHGTACLTEFGLSFTNEFVGTSYLTSSVCGTVLFADPALVQRVNQSQDVVYPTKPCDVYSFGGVMLHVMSGKKPYDGISQLNIFLTVLKGERPPISDYDTSIPNCHKSNILMCWNKEESKRPSAADLVKMFHE